MADLVVLEVEAGKTAHSPMGRVLQGECRLLNSLHAVMRRQLHHLKLALQGERRRSETRRFGVSLPADHLPISSFFSSAW